MKSGEDSPKYFKGINSPDLVDTEKVKCEGIRTLKEFWKALGNNKPPGNEGHIREFYVCFFAEMGSVFVDTVNFCYEQGELSLLTEKSCNHAH